jgi:hypothetical protein
MLLAAPLCRAAAAVPSHQHQLLAPISIGSRPRPPVLTAPQLVRAAVPLLLLVRAAALQLLQAGSLVLLRDG